MSLLEQTLLDFSHLDKPDTNDPFELTETAFKIVDQHLKYDGAIYRPEYALREGGGNCFAWSQLEAGILDSWGIPSAVVLDKTHAKVAAKIGKSVLFMCSTTGHINTIKNEAALKNCTARSKELELLYQDTLPAAFDDGSFNLFFRQEFDGHSMPWTADEYTRFQQTQANSTYESDTAHLIFNYDQAADILNAIGDLARYLKNDREKYDARYDELIQYVPDFMKNDDRN